MALTGTSTSTVPATADIEMLGEVVEPRLNNQFPTQLSGAPGSLSSSDLAAYNQAVGLCIAALLITTPAGLAWLRYVTSKKQGPITNGYEGTTMTPAQAQEFLLGQANVALRQISTIRELIAAAPPAPLFGTVATRSRVPGISLTEIMLGGNVALGEGTPNG